MLPSLTSCMYSLGGCLFRMLCYLCSCRPVRNSRQKHLTLNMATGTLLSWDSEFWALPERSCLKEKQAQGMREVFSQWIT